MASIKECREPAGSSVASSQRIESGEFDGRRGRLKIFLGYASGVGKSVKMLDEGRRRHERGQDVVVGALQAKIPEEAVPIVEKLEVIPLRFIEGRPVMDVDAILGRKPAVVLVDGLAYDNPPGCAHGKRWEDVEELLDAGISVITSINIQFIAEMQEQLETITRKHVSDSVPQKFVRSADEIVVVDAPPETCVLRSTETGISVDVLQQRLSELRELALLLAADVVDRQLEAYLGRNGLASVLTQERLLICLSPEFDASEMIMSGKRSAERFHGDLFALYVRESPLRAEKEARIQQNLEEAEQAGAEVHVLQDDDAVGAVLEFARSQCITQIFVGHNRQGKWWQRLHRSKLENLIRRAEGFDVKVFPH